MGGVGLAKAATLDDIFQDQGPLALRKIEGLLEENEKRLITILETVQVGIMLLDAETHAIVDVNAKAAEMFGARREEIVGSVCHRFICPTKEGNCPITDLGQQLDNAERIMFNAAGDEVPIIKTVAPLEIAGHPYLLESFLDISEQKRAQESLRKSEARYRDLFDNVTDLIMMVRPDCSFAYVNPACTETLGYSAEEMAEMTVESIMAPEEYGCCRGMLEELLREGGTHRVESIFVAHDGRRIPVEGSISCKVENGRAEGVRCIWRDISTRREVEHQREQWGLALERKVEEKSRQLEAAQAKFVQTEKLAALGELAAGAAHELNNPLAGIIGAIQLLSQGKTRQIEEQRPAGFSLQEEVEWLGQMQKAARTCQRVVDDLQRFSRPAQSQFKIVDLNEIVRETVNFFCYQVAQDGILIQTDLDDGLPPVAADAPQLQQVFINIMINARNALQGDGGAIRVTSSRVVAESGGGLVEVAIHDTGGGIPEEHLAKIFDPFFSTQPVGKGTGLGLTVSYGIVKGHGGDIEVTSRIGEGTVVTITLPACGTEASPLGGDVSG